MSNALKDRVQELYEATKDLKSFEELAPHCESFNNWIADSKLSINTLGTKLSAAGFYKLFNALPLEQGKNAESIPKHDEHGNVKSYQLKHYVLTLCGLKPQDWATRNETDRVTNRLAEGQEVDPDSYIEVTGKLLESSDPHELAVGLIAATGRRPHEILARAVFTPVPDEPYKVSFKGQGKKRGKAVEFMISTLFPASHIIKQLNKLRRESSTKALLKEVAKEFPTDITAQNAAIESRRGNSLRRVVQEYFGGRDTKKPVLSFRAESDQNDCKALRAACAALLSERDCDGGVGSKMLFYGRFLGHVDNSVIPTDKDLQNIVTSLGYADYYVTQAVPFPPAPDIEKTIRVGLTHEIRDTINDLKEELEASTQAEVIEKLIDSHLNRAEGVRALHAEIAQLKANNQQLQEKLAMSESNPTADIQAIIAPLVARIEALEAAQANTSATKPQPTQPKEEINWENVSNTDLWTNLDGTSNRAKGSAEEKIRRSFEAITTYNDTIATGDNDRIAITNLGLRALSGVNGLVVGEWIKAHTDEIISHHAKYEMLNPKDPNKVETYFNKSLGNDKINKILELINKELLDGVALKKSS
ncbi:MAG: hypothetical protein KME38_25380 [Spirirestis rafaelensis WJT71-NPBG6]|jgi:molybdopterin converting factor small subunit|nr:hypothetical protein [Spirirestis rafaelensis WJT71-NPBG6]